MSIKIDLSAIDARLDGGRLWERGWGIPSDPTKPTCLHGAIQYCQPVPGDAYLIEQVAARQGWGATDNDRAGSWGALRSRVPAEVTDAALAETFGPQWRAIVALVRRAAVLTEDEARALHASRYASRAAAGYASRYASRAAARAASRYASRAAAWDAAWGASRYASRAAAWEAARALVVRDLIGQHGLTQAHYDVLAGPWASVIGPVHPDDQTASVRPDAEVRRGH